MNMLDQKIAEQIGYLTLEILKLQSALLEKDTKIAELESAIKEKDCE